MPNATLHPQERLTLVQVKPCTRVYEYIRVYDKQYLHQSCEQLAMYVCMHTHAIANTYRGVALAIVEQS